MGAAVAGGVGVVLGALLSGLAGFLMARRAERRQARAAARLLEDELRQVAGRIVSVSKTHERLVEADSGLARYLSRSDLQRLADMPEPRLWSEHRAILASVLSSEDWYAVATAYESVDALRGAALASDDAGGVFGPDGQVAHALVGQQLSDLVRSVQAGAAAVARLAGSPRPGDAPPTINDFVVQAMRRQSLENQRNA